MIFEPQITNKLKNEFKKYDIELVFRNGNKISNLSGTTKDKTAGSKKSGIYAIECGDCERKYYGQTKRNIEKRFKEHISFVKSNQCYRSALAKHILEKGHSNVCIDNLK